MSNSYDREIEELVFRAERRGGCFVPKDRRLKTLARYRAQRGDLHAIYTGVYMSPGTWARCSENQLMRAKFTLRGLQELHPHWVFCGPSAALAYGIDIPTSLLGKTHIASSYSACDEKIVHERIVGYRSQHFDGLHVVDLPHAITGTLKRATFAQSVDILNSVIRRFGYTKEELSRLMSEGSRHAHGQSMYWEAIKWVTPPPVEPLEPYANAG